MVCSACVLLPLGIVGAAAGAGAAAETYKRKKRMLAISIAVSAGILLLFAIIYYVMARRKGCTSGSCRV